MMARAEVSASNGDVIGILPVYACGAALQAAGSTQSASNCLVDAVRLYKVPPHTKNRSLNPKVFF